MSAKYVVFVLIGWLSVHNCLSSEVQFKQDKFVHPGMAQNLSDLEYMKAKINQKDPDWVLAFNNLLKDTDSSLVYLPQAHISVGAYGVNNNGGKALSGSAEQAYRYALIWYISNNKKYAKKAIEIINNWSRTLWDFDDNNAKLSVGLTGHFFLNAAEILKHSDSGWEKGDIKQFEKLMLQVYLPVIEDFFTEANGNWDASMMNTMLCIGVFTDNQQIFNTALARFYFGAGNSGITRYIYPSGQVQETTRDWGHVQLGIGELAKAAAVAWTQGIDLYQAADNRLAKGFEHTAKFMLGDHNMEVYGVPSLREMDKYRDIYESIVDHYLFEKRIALPYTQQVIAKQTHKLSSLGLLTGRKNHLENNKTLRNLSYQDIPAVKTLVGASSSVKGYANNIDVLPGESVQLALDKASGTGSCVMLKQGVHELKRPLYIPSDVCLLGEGKGTIIHLSAEINDYALINASPDFKNIIIKNLLIEGATSIMANADPNHDRRNRSYMSAPSRGGIKFSADKKGVAGTVNLENVTVQNCTKSGVLIKGASYVEILRCDISDNGASVVPGPGLNHNLVLSRLDKCRVIASRIDGSPWGNGIDLSFISNAEIHDNELARNMLAGCYGREIEKASIEGNLAEGNSTGIAFNEFQESFKDINISNNLCWYNAKAGMSGMKVIAKALLANNEITYNYDESNK